LPTAALGSVVLNLAMAISLPCTLTVSFLPITNLQVLRFCIRATGMWVGNIP
jgi:hypothetical protein